MADIKRDFLYEFNRGLKESYARNSAIVSVFEDIDNGCLPLFPVDIPDLDFVENVGRFVFMARKIVADPYKVFKGVQEIVPVSQAQNVDRESIKLTLSDTSLWAMDSDGKRVTKEAYSLVNNYVFTNYENAFIYQLVKLVLRRLSEIKAKVFDFYGVMSIEADGELEGSNQKYLNLLSTVNAHIKVLNRLVRERALSDNSRRVVDMTEIFMTDIIKSDKRYNFCYKFYCNNFKSKNVRGAVTTDFRVLYHNYALVQFMYCINKLGYEIADAEYYLSDSGKMFIDIVEFTGEKKISLIPNKNGFDIKCNGKKVHVEFSRSMIGAANNIVADYNQRAVKFENSDYADVYVAYLTSKAIDVNGVLEIGFFGADAVISRLIEAI